MIYVAQSSIKESDFLSLLEESKKMLMKFLVGKIDISPISFETMVFEKMCVVAKNTQFEGQIKLTGAHAFPDIIANNYFGVEVKMTLGDHWSSTGNSVLESSRTEGVERIYIMFGKFGGKLDIRYRLYQECLPEISVTHSPRYRINMELPEGQSIFSKMGVDYEVLRKSQNVIKKIKDYYRGQLKDGEELWWIEPGKSKSVSPIIRPFRNLSKKERENFITEAMILFPEMFGSSQTKFERAAAYLIAEYNTVSASLRDSFTAGGRMTLKIKGRNILVPQLALRLRLQAKLIKEAIKVMDADKLGFYWRIDKIEKNRLGQWEKMLNENFLLESGVKASDIFDDGLL